MPFPAVSFSSTCLQWGCPCLSLSATLMRSKTVECGEHCWGQLWTHGFDNFLANEPRGPLKIMNVYGKKWQKMSDASVYPLSCPWLWVSLASLSLQGQPPPLTLPPPSISKGYRPRATRVKDPRLLLTWLRLGDPPVIPEVQFVIVVWLKLASIPWTGVPKKMLPPFLQSCWNDLAC